MEEISGCTASDWVLGEAAIGSDLEDTIRTWHGDEAYNDKVACHYVDHYWD